MKKIIFALLALSTVATSCKKDKKNCDLNASNVVGTYKITSASYKADAASPAQDWFALLPACEKDDLFIINSNGTTTITDAGTVCSPSTNDTGIWTLSGSTLTIDGEPANVSSFDCSGMTLVGTGVIQAGDTYTATYVKQ